MLNIKRYKVTYSVVITSVEDREEAIEKFIERLEDEQEDMENLVEVVRV